MPVSALLPARVGQYIPAIMGIQTGLELPNKFVIVSISSFSGFLFSTITSLAVEVGTSQAAMYWHRGKGAAVNIIRKSISSSSESKVADDSVDLEKREQLKRQSQYLDRAFLRHLNASDKKRYEFRYFYMELAESIASVAATCFVVGAGFLSPVEGVIRLSITLGIEFVSDIFVWHILERDGYILANCVARLTTCRMVASVFGVCASLACIMSGQMLAGMRAAVVNGTAVAIGGVNGSNTTTF